MQMLGAVQEMLHGLIRSRIIAYGASLDLQLPKLATLLSQGEEPEWFPVPGMGGGFNIWLSVSDTGVPTLVTENWSRMEGGSGQRHRITHSEAALQEEGFV